MSTQNIASFDISIEGSRYSRPSTDYAFRLNINQLAINGVPIINLIGIQLYLEKGLNYNLQTNQLVPCTVSRSLSLPERMGSWYPLKLINGIDEYGYRQQVPFFYSRPIISTVYHPIYDTRLGGSNWTIDDYKIIQIKNMPNIYGFDCSTIGKEIQPMIPKGKGFIDLEKEWASGGDCFVSILTPRDRTAGGRLALPPPWVITESGLSYKSDRPQLVFIEEGVNAVGLYGEIDNAHIIKFQMIGGKVLPEGNMPEKISRFRNECQTHQTNKKLEGVAQVVCLGLAFYGGLRAIDDFLATNNIL